MATLYYKSIARPTLTWAAALKRKIEIPNTVDHRNDMILLLSSIFARIRFTLNFTTRSAISDCSNDNRLFFWFLHLAVIHKNPLYVPETLCLIVGAANKFLTLRSGSFFEVLFTYHTRKFTQCLRVSPLSCTHTTHSTLHKCTANTRKKETFRKLFALICYLFLLFLILFLFGYTRIIVHMSLVQMY